MTGPATLADLLADNVDVFAWCHKCGRGRTLSSQELAAKLGPKQPVPEIARRIKCSECGGKECTTRPDYRPVSNVIARHTNGRA